MTAITIPKKGGKLSHGTAWPLRAATYALAVITGMTLLSAESIPVVAQNGPTIVVQWNEAALQGVRDSKIGPPMVARALAIIHTCIFDAWAAYDRRAKGTQLGGMLRRPKAERTDANKAKAISFAAYRAAVDLFPGDKATVFDPLMESLGYDPSDTSADTTTLAGSEMWLAMLCWLSATTMVQTNWAT